MTSDHLFFNLIKFHFESLFLLLCDVTSLILMNGHTISAMMENYDVAMLAGHNVVHYNDSLKGDNVHESSEPHSKFFQNSHFDFSSII